MMDDIDGTAAYLTDDTGFCWYVSINLDKRTFTEIGAYTFTGNTGFTGTLSPRPAWALSAAHVWCVRVRPVCI